MALTKPDEKNIEHLYLIVVLSFRLPRWLTNRCVLGQIDIAGYIIYRVFLLHYKYLKAVEVVKLLLEESVCIVLL
jgi:ABC-type Fe3+-siderophore transport system permease subunit